MATKVITLAEGGVPAISLDQVNTTGKGQTFAIPQRHTQQAPGPRRITWGTKMGAVDPDAVTVQLLGGWEVEETVGATFGDILNPVVLDSSTDVTGEFQSAAIGKFQLLQLNVSALTIGGGSKFDGRIAL